MLSVALFKFTLEFYEPEQSVASRKVPLQNAHCQTQSYMTVVKRKWKKAENTSHAEANLSANVFTDGLLAESAFHNPLQRIWAQATALLPPRTPRWTWKPEQMTRSRPEELIVFTYVADKMINCPWAVCFVRWEARHRWHSGICHRRMMVWDEWRSGEAISELPTALYPHRKSWPGLILIPLMLLASLRSYTVERSCGRCRASRRGWRKEQVQELVLPNTNSTVWLGKTKGKRKWGWRRGSVQVGFLKKD